MITCNHCLSNYVYWQRKFVYWNTLQGNTSIWCNSQHASLFPSMHHWPWVSPSCSSPFPPCVCRGCWCCVGSVPLPLSSRHPRRPGRQLVPSPCDAFLATRNLYKHTIKIIGSSVNYLSRCRFNNAFCCTIIRCESTKKKHYLCSYIYKYLTINDWYICTWTFSAFQSNINSAILIKERKDSCPYFRNNCK